MLLVSYEFAVFLLGLLVLYYLISKRYQWIVLLAASYLFYCCGGIAYAAYPIVTTVSTWFLAGRIGKITEESKTYLKENALDKVQKKAYKQAVKSRQKKYLIAGLLFNFGILAVLKYTNFVLANVDAFFIAIGREIMLPYLGWVLPLGISYYTFQTMGYLIDVYNRKYEPEKNLLHFALFASFFPQMIAGPISRFDDLKDQLFSEHPLDWNNIQYGLERLLWGYFKKLVIADRIGGAIGILTADPDTYSGIYGIITMVGYTIWMYADFSGGIDIVIGVAKMFGIKLPENFERPFFSKSLGEFWRRWHMTLMSWLREYIFFPVSTSRFSKKLTDIVKKLFGKKISTKVPVYVATIVVWFTAGIWHGASWNFIAWGMANCVVMLVSQEFAGAYRAFHKKFAFSNGRGFQYFQIIRTFMIFACLEMFEYYPFLTVFRMFGDVLVNTRISQLFDGRMASLGLDMYDAAVLFAGILMMFIVSVLERKEAISRRLDRLPVFARCSVICLFAVIILIVGVYGQGYDASQFIYNQF